MSDSVATSENIGETSERHAGGLRHRNPLQSKDNESKTATGNQACGASENDKMTKPKLKLETGTYWLTRIVILRYLSFVFCKFKLLAGLSSALKIEEWFLCT